MRGANHVLGGSAFRCLVLVALGGELDVFVVEDGVDL